MSQALYDRVRERVSRLSPFMSSRAETLLYLTRAKFDKTAQGHGRYKNVPFSFLPKDMSAIWEVLGEKEYSFLEPYLRGKERPVIMDVGAHIGLFGLWALGENPNASILSIEPSLRTFQTLRGNVQKSIAPRNWQVINAAAWKDDSEISFATAGDSMGHKVSDTGADQTVRGMPLIRMAEQILQHVKAERIDLMKVDIEGSEEQFLMAGESVLPLIDAVVIELHPKLCDTEKVRALLSRHYPIITACADETVRKPLLFCRK